MCIRDSATASKVVVVDADKALLGLRRKVTVDADGMSGITCLLYTSDAAAERSSVDLGGRRIIKKKKT